MQMREMVELAACGIACAVLRHYTGLDILYPATIGHDFDYWVGDDAKQQGLEVSGTLSEAASEMQERQIQKMRQLLANRKRWGGYVVIVGFARREVWGSRHAAGEELP